MPLLDHFNPPLKRSHPWHSFHGAWAAAIARLLNAGVLPEGYYAIPFLSKDSPMEVDVAAVEDGEFVAPSGSSWSPPTPTVSVAVELPALDEVYVEVRSDDGDPSLSASIELVSPGNKDRPGSRHAFTSKCAGHLHRGCSVVVIDAVTVRRANLHAELMELLGAEVEANMLPALSVVSYKVVGHQDEGRVMAWQAALEVGAPLPTVPLWLRGDLAVPLDLEASHAAACVDLRIRPSGLKIV